MKIKIKREIDIPDGFMCSSKCKECSALERIVEDGKSNELAHCRNFNGYVSWSKTGGFFVKHQSCIDAAVNYLREVTKGN